MNWRTISAVGVLILAGCAPDTRHRLLRIFFEGVDKPAAVAPVPVAPTPTNLAASAVVAAAPPVYRHPPYADRQCIECHISSFSEKLRATGTELCAGCHTDLVLEMEKAKFVHRPLDKGQCLRCHDPHSSAVPALLIRAGDDLCWKCHDRVDIAAVKGHANNGNASCLQCHDPHTGDKKWLPRHP